jgi:hypothetical protein
MLRNIEGEGWFVSTYEDYPSSGWWVVDENSEPVTSKVHETKGQALMELEALRNVGYVRVSDEE